MAEVSRREVPSPFDWAGGSERFMALFDASYRRVRHDDELQKCLAAHRPIRGTGGGHAAMVRRHLGRHLSETQRRCWMSLLLGIPDHMDCSRSLSFEQHLLDISSGHSPGRTQYAGRRNPARSGFIWRGQRPPALAGPSPTAASCATRFTREIAPNDNRIHPLRPQGSRPGCLHLGVHRGLQASCRLAGVLGL